MGKLSSKAAAKFSALLGGLSSKKRSSAPPAPQSRPTPSSGQRHVMVEYQPEHDGEPDPGEVVWAWIPYEEDASMGKDRPVVVIGRYGDRLGVVALTSKDHEERHDRVEVGTGPWDREQRVSYARLDKVYAMTADQARREGATLDRERFDRVVRALQAMPDWPSPEVVTLTDPPPGARQ